MEDKAARGRIKQAIPDEGEAIALHKKYGSNDVIIEHCKTVARVARILAEEIRRRGSDIDVDLVYSSALLHDIGRNMTNTVRHGYEGARIAENEGLDPRISEIIRKHVGAGIAPDEARMLKLPEYDYIPRTIEEKVVCFADKMVDINEVREFSEEVKRFIRKGHDVDRLKQLKRDIELILGADPEEIIFERLKG